MDLEDECEVGLSSISLPHELLFTTLPGSTLR